MDSLTQNLTINVPYSKSLQLQDGNNNDIYLSSNSIYLRNPIVMMQNRSTAGFGVPAIYTAYASGSQNGALTAVGSCIPPATAGHYRGPCECLLHRRNDDELFREG